MTVDRRMQHGFHGVKKALLIVVACYAAAGVGITVLGVLAGDARGALLGSVVICGAVGVWVILTAVSRLEARVAALDDRLKQARSRQADHERQPAGTQTQPNPAEEAATTSTAMLDLSALGQGNPNRLVAATLDRSTFPRLLTPVEPHGPPDHASRPRDTGREADPTPAGSDGLQVPQSGADHPRPDRTTQDLLSRWSRELLNHDLAACRSLFSLLAKRADPPTLAALRLQLEALADRVERSLREAFAECVRRRDVPGMVRVGEQMAQLLPDRPLASEFLHIKPYLLRRLAQEKDRPAPSLRVVHE